MDKRWPLKVTSQPYFAVAEAPERLTSADLIEVRVSLTLLRWDPRLNDYDRKDREQLHSVAHIARIEAQDHRALFHIMWGMLKDMFWHYMGLEMKL